MLDIPEHLQKILDLDEGTMRGREFKYKLLWSAIQRYGFRWEYFV